ncbi:MAG: carboxypeptidase regulatory-like domain-containing protein [Bryobacteraceae bacterium]
MRGPVPFSSLLLYIVLLACAASAQTTLGTVRGTVVNASPDPVRLTHVENGRVRESNSGRDFIFTLLPPGRYKLEIAAAGFHTQVREFTLPVNQEIRIDVELSPTSATSVDVTGTRELLKLQSAHLGATVDTRMIQGLPLDGRNFLELSLLTPGAVPAAQGSAGSTRGDFALNINGAREDGNNFVLDGVYNGDPKLNTAGVVSAVDAIREFEVVSSTYDASFGRNGGGQVNVVTRSGGNDIHGTAYQFFRNGAMDSRNYFAPAGEPDPRYQRNQFGFSLGGPVRRNRTFLFGDYEGRRVRDGITRVTNVPTAAERAGDFSQSGLPFLIDPFTQQPFPGSRIPAQRIHPIGGALASLYPLPNRAVPRQNYVSSPNQQDRNDQFDLRLDHQIAARSDLFFRYSFGDRGLFDPFAGPSFPAVAGYGNDVLRRGQNLTIGETRAFTATLLNEFRAAFTRVSSGVLAEGRNGVTNAQVGLPVISANARDAGLTYITVPGYSALGDDFNAPQQSATNTYQLLDTATWARAGHLVKFGLDYRRLQQNAFRDVQSRGFINFFGFTGNALAEVLQGLPVATGVARLDNPQYLRTSSYNFFANDAWRVTPRLTVNLGLRYEYNSPPVDRFDRANVFDTARGSLVPVGQDGTPRSAYLPDKNNIAPRIGVSYLVGNSTVVRGGYGLYFDQSSLAPGEGLYFSAPYFDFRIFVALQQFPLLLHDPFPASYPFPLPSSATAFQRNLRTPYMQHWNFNLQQNLGSSRVFEMGYTGSKGTGLYSARDINQPAPSAAPQNPRPNQRFDDINILESRANSNYHALQTRFQQRFSHGLSALASYTWSKSIDDASNFFASAGDPNFPQDSRNVALERARSNFDVRQRLALSYAYDLPFGQGLWRGGWQTFGIWTFQTGRPFTVALLSELDNSGTGRSVLGFGANDRPHALHDPRVSSPTPDRWFDTEAFAIPARGTFGNAGRNIVDGPGLQSVNASVVKNFALRENFRLQFRAEFFNLFNHTNFDLPDLFVGSPTFGRVSSAQSPRRLQLGLKAIF